MSTTFGISIPKVLIEDNAHMQYSSDAETNPDNTDEIIIPIAFRNNGIRFINPLAHLLPDDTQVIPMDNSHQGIYTIKDIKDNIK